MLLPLYIRREPTSDAMTRAAHARYGGRLPLDTVAYRDPQCSVMAGRWPWHYAASKPRYRCRSITLNCYRWGAVWLPDAMEV